MGGRIDLNCDLGEGYEDDAALFAVVTSANIACGFHAGDTATMLVSARLAVENGVAVGAHPAYRDREGFGRRAMDVAHDQLLADTLVQLRVLDAIARSSGTAVRYVKPHGALYNRIAADPEQAAAVAGAIAAFERPVPLLGLPDSAIERAASAAGVPFRREAFADRAYLADGSLAPRSMPGGVLTDADAVAERAVRIATTGSVSAIDGTEIALEVDSLCVHGDTPGAAALAARVRSALAEAGVSLEAFA